MYYSDDLIEEIRMRNDIVDVISGYIKLQKKGNSYFGLCPFHNEKSPSFSVAPHKQMFHCFGCGEGGNVFSFIMKYENYSFLEALKVLADKAGVQLPEMEYSAEAKKQADLKTTLLEINKQAAKYFYYLLKGEKGRQALDYINVRGLSEETVTKFGLGYSDKYSSGLYQYLKKQGYQDEILSQTGLFTMDERGANDKFRNRVMFPILDINNRVIGFGGRVMGEGMPKYLNSPETKLFDKSRNLYGMNFARVSRKSNLIICEGYMDVIALHQAGFQNAVASLGTALTIQQAGLIKRYTGEVLLAYDSDAAGVKAALRAIPILKDAGLSVKVINMNPYKDPDEFIKTLGTAAFQDRIDRAENSFLYELRVMQQGYDMNDPESKTSFYNTVAKKLLEFTDELERNNYTESVSKEFGIPLDSLKKKVIQMSTVLGGQVYEKPKSGIHSKKEKEDGIKQSQKILLTWLIEDSTLYHKIAHIISENDFKEPLYDTVANMLFEQLRRGEMNPARIISHFESEEEHKEVAALFNSPLLENMSLSEREKALNDTIYKVKKNSLDYAGRTATDISQLQEIIKEQANLQKLHISLG